MKKILLSSMLVGSLFASEQNYFELGMGVINTKDNFSTEQKETNTSLDNAQSQSEAIPYIEFYYGYDISKNTNIYIQSQGGEFNLGSQIDSDTGYFDFGVKANLMQEEWNNPYLTNAKREKVDTKEFGIYAGYGLSFARNHEAMIKYEVSTKSYDKDDVSNELKREGTRHIISFDNMIHSSLFGNQTTYLSDISIEKYKADGKASSYTEYDFEAGLSTKLTEVVRLSLLANIGKRSYDAINTEINTEVDVTIYGAKAVVKWDKPFDFKDTYLSFKTGYEKENANDNFYDRENNFGIVSIGYNF